MAGLLSLGSYSGTVRIPEFKGLNQYGDGIGLDPRFAVEAKNVLTTEGYLRPMSVNEKLPLATDSPIETLALLHRRWHTADSMKDVLIAASDGQLYWSLPSGSAWTKIALPEGISGTRYLNDNWSFVAYEINPEGAEAPVDVLLMSNAQDGMICIRGDDMTATVVPTPKKFGVIARHAERIWGTAIEDDPDMLVYSAPFDPFNWEQNDEIPEDGAGDIMQPSWDGDSFMALATFGSQLLAFKKSRVWRVMGTNPGEYVFAEQFGGGTSYPYTIAVSGSRVLMLGDDGILQYNGETVAPYYQEYASGVFDRVNKAAISKAFACLWNNTYYCALPVDGSQDNNVVLMYDTVERTWLLREGVEVEAFLPTPTALYYTSASTPGHVWRWHEDAWAEGRQAERMTWVTPWQDFGLKNVSTSGYQVYLTVECKAACALNIGIQTEKKLKKKTVVFSPPEYSRFSKQKRVAFGGNGRRFRLIIESETEIPWRIVGGIQIEAETDAD